MQPMNLKETMDNVFNTANLNIKKRKGYVKKVKVVDKHQVNRDTVTSSETTITTIKTEPVSVATTSSYFELETTERPNVHRGKCLYQSRKCEKERAIKRNGKPHNLCEEHRTKQNQHQRKFDAKKFLRKRQRDNVSYEDSELGRGILRLRRNDEPIVKRYRVMANQEAETKTSSAETNSQATAPMVAPMRRNYPTIYATEATPVSAGMTRLPLIPSPRRTSLETMYGAVRPGVIPDAQLRGHVGFSGYRREAGGQSLRVSHRPNLQQQDAQRLVGYTQSELAAASTLTQSQPFRLGATLSTSGSYKKNCLQQGRVWERWRLHDFFHRCLFLLQLRFHQIHTPESAVLCHIPPNALHPWRAFRSAQLEQKESRFRL
ncbi:unnamed protein product [Peronospora belbahrii]|uniref:SBP-type domain-containing protein n=1 Tax=Peronospora belbahrii TaxID=622444 RepID=A0AAU9L0J9_9STRA|nr:unnamed protein product [Peronospora belbahrii]